MQERFADVPLTPRVQLNGALLRTSMDEPILRARLPLERLEDDADGGAFHRRMPRFMWIVLDVVVVPAL